jgi:hypothetical protein
LKVEAAVYSETSINFCQTTLCHIPEQTVLELPQSF